MQFAKTFLIVCAAVAAIALGACASKPEPAQTTAPSTYGYSK